MNSELDQFEELQSRGRPPAQPIFEGEPHAKLKRNLALALDVHRDAMNATLPDIPGGDKRLMVESANMTVKAALTTDRTALKARSDNALERVFLRLLFYRKLRGYPNTPQDIEKLRTAPRGELEAALGAKITVYDKMEW